MTNDYKLLYETNVNGDKIAKGIEDDIELNYNRMLDLWDKCVLCFISLHNFILVYIR